MFFGATAGATDVEHIWCASDPAGYTYSLRYNPPGNVPGDGLAPSGVVESWDYQGQPIAPLHFIDSTRSGSPDHYEILAKLPDGGTVRLSCARETSNGQLPGGTAPAGG
jgi:hypothetical protein